MSEFTGPTSRRIDNPDPQGRLVISTERQPWSPTPNNPNTLLEPDGSPYFVGSLNRLGAIFDALYGKRYLADGELIKFMETVALGTQVQRHAHSSDQYREKKIQTDDELAQRLFYESCIGTATPYQLLELMDMCPELVNCELAKQTHPFDWEAAIELECIVGMDVMKFDEDAIIRDHASKTPARVKLIGNHYVDGLLQAIVLRRKRVYAEVQRDGRAQTVHKVTDLLLDGRPGSAIDLSKLSQRKIELERTPDEHKEAKAGAKKAFEKELDRLRVQSDEMLSSSPMNRSGDIQPIDTYYYAVAEQAAA